MTTRRAFLHTTAGAGPGAALGVLPAVKLAGAPAVRFHRVTPVAVSSGNGLPNFNVNYYAVNKNGEWAAAAIRAGARFAVSVDGEPRLEDSAYLYERS